MQASDYIIKRVAFALITVFVAITLNFILFRTLPGDAIQALRCRQCTEQFKEALRARPRPRQVQVGAVQALPHRPRAG